MKRAIRFWAGFYGALWLWFICLCEVAVAQQDLETDAVYLLDVTSSMVGKGESDDILQKVLDLLLLEIDRFQTGRLVLITFAEGAYDLDGTGPIKAIYKVTVKTEQDKLFLRQFIRPKQYGSFPDDPSWPGIYEMVYEKTYKQRVSIGNTAVYDNILLALEELERFQNQFPGGSEAYIASHTQEIVVFTDGRDNASRRSFSSIVSQLRTRHFQMAERFRYKRYLFSDKREERKQVEEECTTLEKAGAVGYTQNVIASDIAQLVILDLDRQVLGFPNLWAAVIHEDSRTVTLRNIQLFYDEAKAKFLEGGRLVFNHPRAKDFGLPGDIAIKLKTEPTDLIFPFKEFSLSLTFEPASRMEAHLNQLKKEELIGVLQVKFIARDELTGQTVFQQPCRLSSKGKALVDVKNPSPIASLPFIRPSLTVDVKRSAVNQLRLDFTPNKVLSDLSQEQRMLEFHLLPALPFVNLSDESGAPLTWGSTLPLPSRHSTLYATVAGGETPCGDLRDIELRLHSITPSLLINGESRSSISFYYQLASLIVQPSQIITENLWSSERWASSSSEPVTAKFSLGVCSGTTGKLRLFVKGLNVPAQVRIEPETVDLDVTAAQELRFQIIVQPQTDWEALSQKLEGSGPHGYLQVSYEPKRDDVLSVLPELLPFTLSYRPRYVAMSVETLVAEKATPGGIVYRLEVHGVEVPSDKPLVVLQGHEGAANVWKVQRADSSEALPLAGSLPLRAGTYELQLDSNLPRSTQQGTLSFSTQGGWPLKIRLGQQEQLLMDGQYPLNYTLQVGDLLALVNCSNLTKESRWRRGQALLRCEPYIETVSPDAQIEMTPQCDQGLSVRMGQTEQRCGKTMSYQPFEVIIATDAPPGPSAVAQMVEHLEIEIYNRATQKSIETKVTKPEVRGYLLPKPYDQFWEPLLYWLVWIVWGAGLFAFLGAVTYALVWMRENPLIFLINYVWYDERWRMVTAWWLALGILVWLVQAGVAWGMNWSYGN